MAVTQKAEAAQEARQLIQPPVAAAVALWRMAEEAVEAVAEEAEAYMEAYAEHFGGWRRRRWRMAEDVENVCLA